MVRYGAPSPIFIHTFLLKQYNILGMLYTNDGWHYFDIRSLWPSVSAVSRPPSETVHPIGQTGNEFSGLQFQCNNRSC